MIELSQLHVKITTPNTIPLWRESPRKHRYNLLFIMKDEKKNGYLRLPSNNLHSYLCKRTRCIFGQFLGSKKEYSNSNWAAVIYEHPELFLYLWNNETISKIAKESPEVSSYFALVGSPEEYNNINAIIDFFEFLFRLYRTKMLDKELWNRWRASAKSTMNIPKVSKVWKETKGMHTNEFIKFIESL